MSKQYLQIKPRFPLSSGINIQLTMEPGDEQIHATELLLIRDISGFSYDSPKFEIINLRPGDIDALIEGLTVTRMIMKTMEYAGKEKA